MLGLCNKALLLLTGLSLLVGLGLTGCGNDEAPALIRVPVQFEKASLIPITLGETNQRTPKIYNVYSWIFGGTEWSWHINIPESLYEQYKQAPRYASKDYASYVTYSGDDHYLQKMATEISRISEKYGFTERSKVEFTAAFVQSFVYDTDINTANCKEYVRFPLETLVEKRGDCEDTAILLASLLQSLDVRVAFFYFSKTALDIPHVGLGVGGLNDAYGTNWELYGERYYYIETTETGLKIGAIPSEWTREDPEIIAVPARAVGQ
jgi:hypothetical protein